MSYRYVFRNTLPALLNIGEARHSTIDIEHYSRDLVAPEQRDSFLVSHLVETLELATALNGSEIFKRLRPHQIRTLRSLLPENLVSHGPDYQASEQLALEWFDILNSLFFGGGLRTLRDRVFVVWGSRYKGMTMLGRTTFDSVEDRTALIRLNVESLRSSSKFESFEAGLVCTLLHEMIHAWLFYFTCKCMECRVKHRDQARNGGDGVTGHGPAWAKCALCTSESLQDEVVFLIWVGLEDSIVIELMQSKDWIPSLKDLARWGLFEYYLGGGVEELKRIKPDGPDTKQAVEFWRAISQLKSGRMDALRLRKALLVSAIGRGEEDKYYQDKYNQDQDSFLSVQQVCRQSLQDLWGRGEAEDTQSSRNGSHDQKGQNQQQPPMDTTPVARQASDPETSLEEELRRRLNEDWELESLKY